VKRSQKYASNITVAKLAPDRSAMTAPITQSQAVQEKTSRQRGHRKAAGVSWYGKLLIIGTLLLAAGWEIFRWIVAIITID